MMSKTFQTFFLEINDDRGGKRILNLNWQYIFSRIIISDNPSCLSLLSLGDTIKWTFEPTTTRSPARLSTQQISPHTGAGAGRRREPEDSSPLISLIVSKHEKGITFMLTLNLCNSRQMKKFNWSPCSHCSNVKCQRVHQDNKKAYKNINKFFYLSLLNDISRALKELTLGRAYKKILASFQAFYLSLLNVGSYISRALRELTLRETYKKN